MVNETETKRWQVLTTSPEQTIRLGEILGGMLPAGSCVALVGDLGSGKTVLAKGIARGLGVADEGEVTSPSFVLVNEYRGRVPIFHLDLYRLTSKDEVEALGWDEIVSGPAVILVEWAEKIPSLLPGERTEVLLEWAGTNERRVTFIGKGRAPAQGVERLGQIWSKEQ